MQNGRGVSSFQLHSEEIHHILTLSQMKSDNAPLLCSFTSGSNYLFQGLMGPDFLLYIFPFHAFRSPSPFPLLCVPNP